jgi:hypothetical protein
LEYVLRLELVVNIAMKKVFIHPLAFGDTESSTGSKMAVPQWGDIFNRISREEYLEYVPHSDLDVRELSD